MEVGSSQPTISERARRCLASFQECLAGMTKLGPIRKSLIEDEFARFSIWTSNVGIFASGRASMDYRLRMEPNIQRLVLGLLEVLHGHIEHCMFYIAFLLCFGFFKHESFCLFFAYRTFELGYECFLKCGQNYLTNTRFLQSH